MRHEWSKLNRLQKGTFGEYFAKMEFAMFGFEVYTSEVDDRGIDFIARRSQRFVEVQVKTVSNHNLQFVNESKFKATDDFVVALVRLIEGEPPVLHVFRGTEWPSSDGLLVFAPYDGKKSEPAYEIRLASSRDDALRAYEFEHRAHLLGV